MERFFSVEHHDARALKCSEARKKMIEVGIAVMLSIILAASRLVLCKFKSCGVITSKKTPLLTVRTIQYLSAKERHQMPPSLAMVSV
jgi:hypothetical protein